MAGRGGPRRRQGVRRKSIIIYHRLWKTDFCAGRAVAHCGRRGVEKKKAASHCGCCCLGRMRQRPASTPRPAAPSPAWERQTRVASLFSRRRWLLIMIPFDCAQIEGPVLDNCGTHNAARYRRYPRRTLRTPPWSTSLTCAVREQLVARVAAFDGPKKDSSISLQET